VTNPSEDLVRSGEVTSFATTVEVFCVLVENSDSYPLILLLEKLDELLPLLYHRACSLPRYPWDDEDDESEEGWRAYDERTKHVDELERSLVKSRRNGLQIERVLEKRLGSLNDYSFVFDPADPSDSEAIDGRIAHDIDSIYWDVRIALDLYHSGDELAMRQAIWDWGFRRKIHWGFHLLSGLTAISSLIHRHYDEDDEDFTR
jgi:hypothetical protein